MATGLIERQQESLTSLAALSVAAEVTVAYSFGWRLDERGASIENFEKRATFLKPIGEPTELSWICFNCAGSGAARVMLPKQARPPSEKMLRVSFRGGGSAGTVAETRQRAAFNHIRAMRRGISEHEAIAIYRAYDTATSDLLSRADVWLCIWQLWTRLRSDGDGLTHAEVQTVLSRGSPTLLQRAALQSGRDVLIPKDSSLWNALLPSEQVHDLKANYRGDG